MGHEIVIVLGLELLFYFRIQYTSEVFMWVGVVVLVGKRELTVIFFSVFILLTETNIIC